MSKLDGQKLLANDAATIKHCVKFVAAYLRRYISDSEIVADATQSAMVRLIAKLKKSGNLSPEDVARELSNAANNALRRQLTQLRRRVTHFQSQLHTKTSQATEEYARNMDNRKEIKLIEQALADLDARHAAMFIAKVQGFTNQEIAARHGATEDSVRGITVRARQKLRMKLTAEEKRDVLIGLVKQVHQEAQSPFRSGANSSSA